MGPILRKRLLPAALCALATAVVARAQIAAPDSLPPSALPDSLLSSAAPDSGFVAVLDSSATPSTSPIPEAMALPDADYRVADFDRELPEGLDATLRRMPGLQLRVHGERGAAAYLSSSPIGEVAPEILVDGVPVRSPADLDPSVFDISSGDLAAVRIGDGHFGAGGGFDLRLSRRSPVKGRTLTRAQFSSTRGETYYRSLSVSTPQAQHLLRMNFEEWKSELGVDYADQPINTLAGFGYAKQRRFSIEMRTRTPFGELLGGFGRGRRSSPGSLLGLARDADATERWTVLSYLGLNQHGANWTRSLRIYQSDAREVDESGGFQSSQPQSAGQRYGLRVEQLAPAGGWSALLQAERWSAVWHPLGSDVERARGRWIARAGIAHDLRPSERWSLRAGWSADYAEQLDEFDSGGSLRLRFAAHDRWQLEAGAARSLRIPTLLESDGRRGMDFADGVRRDLVGTEGLSIERQDRLHAGVSTVSDRWRAEIQLENWSLTRGVGQLPVGDELHFVGDAEVEIQQLRAEAGLQGQLERSRWSLAAAGHRVLGDLTSSRGRASGWPTHAAQARAHIERPWFSPRNALVGDLFWKWSGTRLDDRMAPLGGVALAGQPALSPTLPEQHWVEFRAALRIRDAELYLAWDNLLDGSYAESFGTIRRPRQLRWGLFWTFYN